MTVNDTSIVYAYGYKLLDCLNIKYLNNNDNDLISTLYSKGNNILTELIYDLMIDKNLQYYNFYCHNFKNFDSSITPYGGGW